LLLQGKVELRRQEELIEAAVKQAFRMQLGGAAGQQAGWGQCLAVLVNDEMAKKRSQLGNRLSERSQELGLRPMGCVAYQEDVIGVGKVKLSFRSIGPEDTTVISQAYNGGGHLNASSCIIDEATFNTWRC
jgi:nanoRNase/pAp phosphatase (c-di-AMP/oligoRNAs hydrolase)